MSNLTAMHRPVAKSILWVATLALVSSATASAYIHVYPINANKFFADAGIVALARVNSVTAGRTQGHSALTVVTLNCFKGCTVDSELRVLV